MKSSRMMLLMILSHKKHCFALSLEDTYLEKPKGGQTDPAPAF